MIEPSANLQAIFEKSINIAKSLNHEYITIEHLVYSIMEDAESYSLLEKFGANASFIKTNIETYVKTSLDDIKLTTPDIKPKKTNSVERVLNRSFTQVLFSGRQQMEVADVIISILSEKNSYGYYFLTKGGVTKESFVKYFQEQIVPGQQRDHMMRFAEHRRQAVMDEQTFDRMVAVEYHRQAVSRLRYTAAAVGLDNQMLAQQCGQGGVGVCRA